MGPGLFALHMGVVLLCFVIAIIGYKADKNKRR